MNYKDEISALIEKRQNEMVSISDNIWDYAETRFQEFKSSKLHMDYLNSLGFRITKGLG